MNWFPYYRNLGTICQPPKIRAGTKTRNSTPAFVVSPTFTWWAWPIVGRQTCLDVFVCILTSWRGRWKSTIGGTERASGTPTEMICPSKLNNLKVGSLAQQWQSSRFVLSVFFFFRDEYCIWWYVRRMHMALPLCTYLVFINLRLFLSIPFDIVLKLVLKRQTKTVIDTSIS